MFLRMKPAQWMGPAFPAFLAPSGATPFDTDLAELMRSSNSRPPRGPRTSSTTRPRPLLCRNQISRRFSGHSDSHRSLPPNGPIHWHLTLDQSPFKHNRTAGLQQNKTDNCTAGLQQNKTASPATSDRSVDDLFVIAYQIYALALGLLIAYLISTAV